MQILVPRAASPFRDGSKPFKPVADAYRSGADSQCKLCSMPVNMRMLTYEITIPHA